MPDVQVACDEREGAVGAELAQARPERVEELPLLVLLRGVGLAGVHVGAHDGERAIADQEVGFDPATLGVEVVGAEIGAGSQRGSAAGDGDAGPPLRCGLVVHESPAGECGLEVLVLPADLLEREDVDAGIVQPGAHPVASRRSDSVDIDRGDTQMGHGSQA